MTDPTDPTDPTKAELRKEYATAIRDQVRVRLGTNSLRLAENGIPVQLNFSEAEAAADAAMGVRDAEMDQLIKRNAEYADRAITNGKRAEEAEAALELMTAERDRWLGMLERMATEHMRFGVIREDGTVEMLPCADWCSACKAEELARLKSCQDPHCMADFHVIPDDVPPKLLVRGCPAWHRSEDHDEHDWSSRVEGVVLCPGWDSEGVECECGRVWADGQMPPWHNDMNCEEDPTSN